MFKHYSLCKTLLFSISVIFLLAVTAASFGEGYLDLEKQIVQHKLPNGLTLLILERHDAPVFSFHTHVDAGSVNEQVGETGLAHMFEHMAFMGTKTIGATDYQKEAKALDAVDQSFEELFTEQQKGEKADSAKITQLQAAFGRAQEEADKYVVSEEFSRIVEQHGGVGLNASTWVDFTWYYYSLPSNKIELWALLESGRMADPVLRRFYKERSVVMEERRMRTDSDPEGRLAEEFLTIAYKAHPYRFPTIGHMSDLEALTRPQAEAFYKRYYGASNMTVAIVGDVKKDQIIALAEKYFAKLPGGPKPPGVWTVEPPQVGERRVVIEDPSQPVVMIGYHRPGMNHPDNAVFETLADILGSGRTSRLYKRLVKEKRIAMSVSVYPDFPGDKYPTLFFFHALPSVGHTADEVEAAIYEEIELAKREPVTEEELNKAKTRARADLIRSLKSDSGMALRLSFYETITGDWRNLFRAVDKINAVTVEDIRQVANEYFEKKNRIVGLSVTTK